MRVIFKIHIFVFDTVQVHVGGKATSIKTIVFCAVKTRPLFKIQLFVIDTEQINLGRRNHKFMFVYAVEMRQDFRNHIFMFHTMQIHI